MVRRQPRSTFPASSGSLDRRNALRAQGLQIPPWHAWLSQFQEQEMRDGTRESNDPGRALPIESRILYLRLEISELSML